MAEVVRPATGGIRRHVSDLLEHLDRRHFTPLLCAPEAFVPDRPIPDLARVSVDIGATTRPLRDYKAVHKLAQLLPGNVDIVHAHGLRGAVVGGFAARRARLPYLFTLHNLLPPMNFVQKVVLSILVEEAARVIVVSKAIAQTLLRAGERPDHIEVIPNGVDLTRFESRTDTEAWRSEHGIEEDEQVVLAVGRLSPEKGFDVLVDAFTALHAGLPQTRLLIAGEGSEAAQLKAQAAPLGDRILFLGHQPNTVPLYAVADLVVAPSRQEGQGIVPLEAMAAGRAVVASRVGGLVETIIEGETGLLTPPDNVHALCGTMEQLLNDPERRAAMGAAGRQRVEEEYSLQVQLQKIEAIYRDVYRRTA